MIQGATYRHCVLLCVQYVIIIGSTRIDNNNTGLEAYKNNDLTYPQAQYKLTDLTFIQPCLPTEKSRLSECFDQLDYISTHLLFLALAGREAAVAALWNHL